MAVTKITAQCWLCHGFYLPEELVPLRVPETVLQVEYDDGHTEAIGTGEAIRPTCSSCKAKLTGLTTYRGKTAL